MENFLICEVVLVLISGFLPMTGSYGQKSMDHHDGWKFHCQRNVLAPIHSVMQQDDKHYQLILEGGNKAHANGSWVKNFSANGATFVRFSTEANFSDVDEPSHTILSSIVWRNDEGKKVGPTEYPKPTELNMGHMLMKQVYRVPTDASQAEVSLIYRWDEDGKVVFTPARMEPVSDMPKRLVKLAAVHHRPRNSSTEENLKAFSAYAAKAGEQGADIVCLPEAITLVGTGQVYTDVAESIPGPTSKHLGQVAQEHEMYIAAGILERDGDVVYNTAILLDRSGRLAGKYRKVALPREEIEGGVTPGNEFPVFETDFGTVGMMICWDVAFPEPARQLALQGAEVILLPIWGGNINLAKARAIENQVYLVSSTYDMRTGVFDLEGDLIVEGTDDHPVSIVEVDLDAQKLWPWLGEFKNRIRREMPPKEALAH